MAADILHNLTDGLAIGTSFRIDPILGISTAFSIFSHELAHEIGDFAQLIELGFSLKKALLANILTGLANLTGTILSLCYGTMNTLEELIMPIIIGNFFYVSITIMLVKLKENNRKTQVLEIVGFVVGVWSINIVSWFIY